MSGLCLVVGGVEVSVQKLHEGILERGTTHVITECFHELLGLGRAGRSRMSGLCLAE